MVVLIISLALVCVFAMVWRLRWEKPIQLSLLDYFKLGISGVVAFIADTLGVGSFSVNIALAKLLNTFDDEELPAMNNGAQVIPGTFESLYFMSYVSVDCLTLVSLVGGACIGGLLGGFLVSRLKRQRIRLVMMICFAFILMLLILHQLNLMPQEGDILQLRDSRLLIGFLGMILCGALTSVGIGLFVLVQSLLFLLNVSPLIAFPIMTTAGAMQQPLTTMVFLKEGKIPLKKTFILSLSGCFGVYLALMLIDHLKVTWLHTLLILIVVYNLVAMTRTWLKERTKELGQVEGIIVNG